MNAVRNVGAAGRLCDHGCEPGVAISGQAPVLLAALGTLPHLHPPPHALLSGDCPFASADLPARPCMCAVRTSTCARACARARAYACARLRLCERMRGGREAVGEREGRGSRKTPGRQLGKVRRPSPLQFLSCLSELVCTSASCLQLYFMWKEEAASPGTLICMPVTVPPCGAHVTVPWQVP